MSAGAYARGSKAWATCQRCGLRDLLNNLVFDEYFPGMRVHPDCKDYKHPQEHLVEVRDPIALWKPAPEDYLNVAPVLSGSQATTTIPLTWTAATTHQARIENYAVYRSVNAAEFTLISTQVVTYTWDGAIDTETLSYTDIDFTLGDLLDYYVVALDINNNGLSSNTVQIQTG